MSLSVYLDIYLGVVSLVDIAVLIQPLVPKCYLSLIMMLVLGLAPILVVGLKISFGTLLCWLIALGNFV